MKKTMMFVALFLIALGTGCAKQDRTSEGLSVKETKEVGDTIYGAPGWNRSITVEWGYDAPADLVLTGFKMYQEGVPVCDFTIPDARTGSCDIILLKRSTPFTLTAVFQGGEESPHSDAHILVDWGPKPRIIRLLNN